MKDSAPLFVWILLEFVGGLLVASGIPLALRRVPPNLVYGVRFHATLRNEAVWYDVNARGGRHFIAIGISYLILLNTLLVTAWADEITMIGLVLGFAIAVTVLDAIVLYASARRMGTRNSTVAPPSTISSVIRCLAGGFY